jgi:hypothetical protein
MKPKHDSWIRLIAFCFTSTLTAGMALAVIMAAGSLILGGETVAAAQNSERAPSRIYSGVITDSFCGARHAKYPNLNAAECTRICVQKGAKYMMVNGDVSYLLEGNIADLNGLAGQRVEARGRLEGDTIYFTEIGFLSAAK